MNFHVVDGNELGIPRGSRCATYEIEHIDEGARRARRDGLAEVRGLVGSGQTPCASFESSDSTSTTAATSDGPRRWLLAATMALFVARPLFPSESVGLTGEGIPLVIL